MYLKIANYFWKTTYENEPEKHNKKTRGLMEKWRKNDGVTIPIFPHPITQIGSEPQDEDDQDDHTAQRLADSSSQTKSLSKNENYLFPTPEKPGKSKILRISS